ncbi:MAG: RluA family pseudouridine synthase [Acidimicrobiales bacterium]
MSGDRVDAAVPAMLDGVRLDRVVAFVTGRSRDAATQLIANGNVRVDGTATTRRNTPVRAGSTLSIELPDAEPGGLVPEPDVEFGVVHVDEDVVVVDKPWDLVVHPGAGRERGTLAAGVLARFPEVGALPGLGLGEADRPGIVHRLDRGTSGLLVVARTPRAFGSLSEQLSQHRADRRYAALVHGHVEADRGVVDAPVGRSARRPTHMTVSSTGREARTAYEVMARYDRPVPSTLVVATLETGRTHQIRVHMAAIGHPVVGDARYGSTDATQLADGRFFLHAFELSFDHPADDGPVTYRAPVPADLVAVLGQVPELG